MRDLILEKVYTYGYLPIMPVNARDKAGTNGDNQGQAGTNRDNAGKYRDKAWILFGYFWNTFEILFGYF